MAKEMTQTITALFARIVIAGGEIRKEEATLT